MAKKKKRRKKKGSRRKKKTRRSNHVPLKILEKRLGKLTRVVKSRGGKLPG